MHYVTIQSDNNFRSSTPLKYSKCIFSSGFTWHLVLGMVETYCRERIQYTFSWSVWSSRDLKPRIFCYTYTCSWLAKSFFLGEMEQIMHEKDASSSPDPPSTEWQWMGDEVSNSSTTLLKYHNFNCFPVTLHEDKFLVLVELSYCIVSLHHWCRKHVGILSSVGRKFGR